MEAVAKKCEGGKVCKGKVSSSWRSYGRCRERGGKRMFFFLPETKHQSVFLQRRKRLNYDNFIVERVAKRHDKGVVAVVGLPTVAL